MHVRTIMSWKAPAVALAAAGAILVCAPSAFAHAIVSETEPRIDQVVDGSPESVVMRFNEPVELAFGAIRVFDTNGDRVDAGEADHVGDDLTSVAVPLEGDLPNGTYTVTWRVVSADGHPIAEAFVFHVGAPGSRPGGIADEILRGQSGAGPIEGAVYGAARWLNFAGLVLLAGAVFFRVVIWRREASEKAEERFGALWKRIVTWAWVAVCVATLASFVLQGAVAGDLSFVDALAPSVLSEVAETRFGVVSLIKIGALVVLGVFWTFRDERWFGPLALVLLLPVLASPGLAGHAGSTDPVTLNVAADLLHIGAVAAWIGGLVVLLTAVFPAVRLDGGAIALSPVVGRFSRMAMIAVAVILVTGTYASWVQVQALRALTGATYGVVLLSKIAVFIPIVLLGAFNQRVMKPRIERAADADDDDGRGALSRFRKLLLGEVGLAAVVLALTALLVNLPPAKVEAGVEGPFITDVRLGDDNLNVLIDPNEVGANEMHFTVSEASGAPAPIKAMRILFRMPDEDIGPLVAQGKRLAPGHYIVQGSQLSVAGEWHLEVVARTNRFDEERTEVVVRVNP
ncbi:MAG: copper resistance CopC/CopD family protein [Actinomycetota bacterium]